MNEKSTTEYPKKGIQTTAKRWKVSYTERHMTGPARYFEIVEAESAQEARELYARASKVTVETYHGDLSTQVFAK